MGNTGNSKVLQNNSMPAKRRSAKKKKIYGRIPILPLAIIGICLFALFLLNYCDLTQNIIEFLRNIVSAVLASFIFIFILNIRPPLQINEQLVIRYEESNENHPLTISLLVGNKWVKFIGGLFDLKLTFVYSIRDGARSNMAIAKSVERRWIDKYYRASIELNKMDEIEKSFWKDYLTLEPSENENAIFVIISGSAHRFGSNFRYLIKYPRSCILIGEDCIGALDKEKNTYVDIRHGKLKPMFSGSRRDPNAFDWTAFNTFYPYLPEFKHIEDKIKQDIQDAIDKETDRTK